MPKLSDFRQTKTITLPSYPDSQVEIYDSLLVGDALAAGIKPGNEMEGMVKVLPALIKSWNFTGNDEKPLPIIAANLNFLKADDLGFLLKSITEFAEETKKK